METDSRKRVAGIILPGVVLTLGIVLLVLNIVIEDEPGAIPLLILVIGAGWLVIQRIGRRKRKAG